MATLSARLGKIKERISEEGFSTDKGVSFLEVKYHMLLQYCSYIMVYLLLKVQGKLTKGHPVFAKLVYIRTVIEKLKPLDEKLKYQIDKLLQTAMNAEAQSVTDQQALNFKPNLDALISEDEEENSEGEDTAKGGSSSHQSTGVYRAPRLSATPYEVSEQNAAEREKKAAKLKRILAKSQILREEQAEMSSRPMVVKDSMPEQEALEREDREIRAHEEKNFTRLVMSKKDKQRRKQLQTKVRTCVFVYFTHLSLCFADYTTLPPFFQLTCLFHLITLLTSSCMHLGEICNCIC